METDYLKSCYSEMLHDLKSFGCLDSQPKETMSIIQQYIHSPADALPLGKRGVERGAVEVAGG